MPSTAVHSNMHVLDMVVLSWGKEAKTHVMSIRYLQFIRTYTYVQPKHNFMASKNKCLVREGKPLKIPDWSALRAFGLPLEGDFMAV